MLANSIREASSPLRVVGGFLGICLLDYEKFYFNHLYMLAIWIFYACATIRLQIFFVEEGIFSSIIGISAVNANGIIAFITAFFNASYKQTSDRCYKALCIVDDTLKSLGIWLEYRTVYRESLIIFILLSVVSVTIRVMFIIGSGYSYSVLRAFCMGTMFAYPLFLTNISDFNYWIILRKLHRQLKKTSREINRMFGVDFGLQMGVFFFTVIELISLSYVVYFQPNKIIIKKALYIISQILGQLLHFTKLVLINCACENVQRKSKDMAAVLTKYINTVHDFESCQEMHQFLMQVKYRPLQFTALGFISLGYICLTSMVTSMAEIVIIMIQLGAISHANYLRPERNITTND